MLTKREMQGMLEARGLAPKKSLGQNFLVDQNLLRKLLDASGVGEGDVVLEVGPGAGVLTRALMERGCRVVAVELDAGLADLIRETIDDARLMLIEGDCLPKGRLHEAARAALADAAGGGTWRMVANLPYGAASPLLVDLFVRRPTCDSVHVTVQKEVAERIFAKPGTKAYGSLGVICQAMAKGEVIADAPGSCFWPAPKVTSAMISLRRRADPLTDDPERLEAFARALFMKRRKQLGSILGRDAVEGAGVDPTVRPEGLDVAQLASLERRLREVE
jgi:16S rRNA (adenine1518-N6/adenine1519-N6)-dimethyltransferase